MKGIWNLKSTMGRRNQRKFYSLVDIGRGAGSSESEGLKQVQIGRERLLAERKYDAWFNIQIPSIMCN